MVAAALTDFDKTDLIINQLGVKEEAGVKYKKFNFSIIKLFSLSSKYKFYIKLYKRKIVVYPDIQW